MAGGSLPTTVQAAVVEAPGRLAVGPVTLAQPAEGDCVIEMRFAGVNPLDTYVLAGRVGSDAPYPRVLGVEGCGYHEGRLVALSGAGVGVLRDGTWAQAGVMPRSIVAEVPAGLSAELAAACGVAGVTAVRVLCDLGRVGAGERVVVLGASGTVGIAVCSLATALGAEVIGQTANAQKAKAIASAGARPATAADPESLFAIAKSFGPADLVIDALGGNWSSMGLALLRPHGRIVSYGTAAGAFGEVDLRTLYRNNITWQGYGGMADSPATVSNALARAMAEVAAGRMRLPIGEAFPLREARRAVDAVEAHRGIGRVLLEIAT